MTPLREGDLLWTPGEARCERSHVLRFMRWLEEHRGLRFESYEALWRWSVTDLESFWGSVWDFFGVQASTPFERVLGRRAMPGAEWFPGARLNYAGYILARERPDATAIISVREGEPLQRMSWAALGDQVRILATQLRRMGVRPGDRVAAVLPNAPQAAIAMLATTCVGAIWSCCGPDFGTKGVLERFRQLAPRVFFYVDEYQYGGKHYDRSAELRAILKGLDSVEHAIHVPYTAQGRQPAPAGGGGRWEGLIDQPPVAAGDFACEQVPFDHPLWILFSPGTPGLPKPIVHGHGGILLEHLKALAFHQDLRPGDVFTWYTTTGWMMWNYLAGGLLAGLTIVLYDGSATYPATDRLWRLAAEHGVTYLGVGAPYLVACMKAELHPGREVDLAALRAIGSTGSPLPPEAFGWVYDRVSKD